MRLKSLELVGFKSFRDRTVIFFDQPITGIVGPNGSGKSNIVDALVWVLGEQSAKDLRGQSMQDVIFAGSENYPPSEFAQVSLTIENDGVYFPLKWMHQSELTITRRLWRDGASEYLINKEPARLRDIQEIFLDTGVGVKGFAIIQQGTIGRFVSAKPLEKRMILEEVAGISKFKTRKKESLKKMQWVDENLSRLELALKELENQKNILHEQAQKAILFKQIREELRKKESLLAGLQWLNCQNQICELQKQQDDKEKLKSQWQATLESLRSDLENRRLSQLELENEIRGLEQERQALEKRLNQLELEWQRYQLTREHSENVKDNVNQQLTQIESQILTVTQQQQSIENEIKQWESNLCAHQSHLKEMENEVQELEKSWQQLDGQLTQKKQRFLALDQAVHRLKIQDENLKRQVDEAYEELQNLTEREKKWLEDLQQWQKQSQEVQDLFERLETQRQQCQQQLAELEEKLQKGQKELDQIQKQIQQKEKLKAQLEGKIKALEDLERQGVGWQEGVKNFFDSARKLGYDQVFEILSRVIRIPDSEMEEILTALWRQQWQWVVVADFQAWEKVVQARDWPERFGSPVSFLMPDGHGEKYPQNGLPFMRLSEVLDLSDERFSGVRNYFDRIYIVNDRQEALEGRRLDPTAAFLTRDGYFLDFGGLWHMGAKPHDGVDVTWKRQKEIQNWQNQLEDVLGQLAQDLSRRQDLEQQQNEYRQHWQQVQSQWQFLQKDLLEAQRQKAEWDVRLKHGQMELDRLAKRQHQLHQKLLTYQQQQEEIHQKLQQMENERCVLQEEIQQDQQQVLAAQNLWESRRRQWVQAQVNFEKDRSQWELLLKERERLEASLRSLTGQQEQLRGQKEKAYQEGAQALEELQRIESEKDLKVRRWEDVKNRESQLRQQWQWMHNQLLDLEDNVRRLSKDLQDLDNQILKIQWQLEPLKSRIEELEQNWNLRFDEALGTFVQNQGESIWQSLSEADLQQETHRLRRRLEDLKDVNLLAVEEYERVKQKYESLVGQHQDVFEAKRQLLEVIERIDQICDQKLKQTFDQVNETFQKVLPALFGGGSGYLTWVQDPDSTEPGVDVIVSLPGKKLQSMSLFSGGEKALVAIAFIFAIFLIKPSPFCLLDEVDAPLDDANVSRFNELVRQMAKRSQVVMVTHNKHTMGICHRLYGVTMQEKGISHLVQVRLQAQAETPVTN